MKMIEKHCSRNLDRILLLGEDRLEKGGCREGEGEAGFGVGVES